MIVLTFVMLVPVFASASFSQSQTGKHYGEAKNLEYSIEYLDPLGVTIANETGITFLPFSGGQSFDPTVLPEQYFDEYPLYFSGGTLHFIVHIKNTGKRTFRNLLVKTAKEFLNTEGGTGEPFPENNTQEWFVENLLPGEKLELLGTFEIPNIQTSGIDQTHLQILHLGANEAGQGEGAPGRIIVDDPQAGLWCPTTT